MPVTQPSKLLSDLFAPFDPEQRLTVLNIGAALPETVDFFAHFRCKLFFADVFSELPIVIDEASETSLDEYFCQILNLPEQARVDVLLFWDVFNYLDKRSVTTLMKVLRPHLHAGSRGHGFAVHNRNSPQGDQQYGIAARDLLNVRRRTNKLPGYRPHPQSQLRELLQCFEFDRSVLLSDSRLELLLTTRFT
ncbi:MAG: hypothetical protein V7746_17535 [Halioglobus sp.]